MDPLQAQIQNQLLVQALQGPKPATQAMPSAINQMGAPPPNYMNQMGQPPGMLGAMPPAQGMINAAIPGGPSVGQNMQGMGQQPQMTPALQKLLAGTL